MTTTKIIGWLLIVTSIALGYFGVTKISDNTAAIKIVNIEINLSDKDEKQKGYLCLGIAALLFVGGIYAVGKK